MFKRGLVVKIYHLIKNLNGLII